MRFLGELPDADDIVMFFGVDTEDVQEMAEDYIGRKLSLDELHKACEIVKDIFDFNMNSTLRKAIGISIAKKHDE